MQGYGDDDYLIFDCPGQIELYSHATVFRTFVDWMRGQGWSMCAVYCLDSQFVSETPKFIAGSLQALAAMVQLELPHVNVLTKVDLIADKVRSLICLHVSAYVAVDEEHAEHFQAQVCIGAHLCCFATFPICVATVVAHLYVTQVKLSANGSVLAVWLLHQLQ